MKRWCLSASSPPPRQVSSLPTLVHVLWVKVLQVYGQALLVTLHVWLAHALFISLWPLSHRSWSCGTARKTQEDHLERAISHYPGRSTESSLDPALGLAWSQWMETQVLLHPLTCVTEASATGTWMLQEFWALGKVINRWIFWSCRFVLIIYDHCTDI